MKKVGREHTLLSWGRTREEEERKRQESEKTGSVPSCCRKLRTVLLLVWRSGKRREQTPAEAKPAAPHLLGGSGREAMRQRVGGARQIYTWAEGLKVGRGGWCRAERAGRGEEGTGWKREGREGTREGRENKVKEKGEKKKGSDS